MNTSFRAEKSLPPVPCVLHPRPGFTLVELLVVITIIGVLAALITAAAAGALRRAEQSRIQTEIEQITAAVQTYKDSAGSYPPNCQTDDENMTAEPATSPNPINEQQVFTDLKRHLKQAFPKHRESDNLLRVIAGLPATGSDAANYPEVLAGGMSAGEALVFWLGGFSNDPKYPISGEGGPSYPIAGSDPDNNQLDPIESRKWVYPFVVARLQPRDTDNYFDDSERRYIEYTARINGQPQLRRINFWQYTPSKSEQPFLYFDVSRSEPTAASDVPAATSLNPSALHVHPIKQRSESAGAALPFQFANKDKFQLLHCGVDGEWGEDVFESQMSIHGINDPADLLLYPDGPFTGEVADTLTNFSEGTLEASQP